MSHSFRFIVDVTVDRDSGPFAARDELAEQISEAIENADPGTLSGDNGGEYSISGWSVSEEPKGTR